MREHVRVPFRSMEELPDGPGVYVVWSALGAMFGLAGLGDRPLYVGMTKRGVILRMREHLRDDDHAIPTFESEAEIEYYPCQNAQHARALERELQEELDPFYGTG